MSEENGEWQTICEQYHVPRDPPNYKITLNLLAKAAGVKTLAEVRRVPWEIEEFPELQYSHCVCGTKIENNVNFIVNCQTTDSAVIVCTTCKNALQFHNIPHRAGQHCDDDSDHVVRSVEFKHVLLVWKRIARLAHIEPPPEKPIGLTGIDEYGNTKWLRNFHYTWEEDTVGRYDNCICGHAIVRNMVVTCIETGLHMTVGSECVQKVVREDPLIDVKHITKRCERCNKDFSGQRGTTCKPCIAKLCRCGKDKKPEYRMCYECNRGRFKPAANTVTTKFHLT